MDVQNVDMASKISQSVRHACRSSRFCRTHGPELVHAFGGEGGRAHVLELSTPEVPLAGSLGVPAGGGESHKMRFLGEGVAVLPF